MRNILAIGALTLAIGLTTPADAQYRSYHNHYHGGGGGWAAPLVGGLIIGGMVGALANQPRYYDPPPVVVAPAYPPQPTCWREFLGYNQFGRPVYRTVCE
jgi:hypothetical protein